ncbi:P-loop containing nucleoside triphosphate hydrolase protein [Peniophora sp. CONT]|nr:P-loop containing nucleoside triphosphate hydrolase protein [Peniophora sp. CONT]
MDEGHTILHWKDFRPLMDHLKTITTRFPGVPVTIATASLTLADRTNLLNHLSIPPSSCHIISGSLNRPNLVYTIQPIHTFQNKRKLEAVYDFLKDQFGLRPESWCTQPKRAAYGERNGMDREAQRAAVKKWMDGDVQSLMATIAFGMGIDKPDVAFVIHYDMPKTFGNYIQETGRAGHNGERALCLLFLSWQDVHGSASSSMPNVQLSTTVILLCRLQVPQKLSRWHSMPIL